MHLCLYYNMMESDLQPQEPWKYMKNCETIYMRIVRKFTYISAWFHKLFGSWFQQLSLKIGGFSCQADRIFGWQWEHVI